MTPESYRQIVSGEQQGTLASLARLALAVLEPIYRFAMRRRNERFDREPSLSHSVDACVISVGNLTLGGTGKTPITVWLARWFTARGVRVALVSRGYGGHHVGPNDEALEMSRRLPNVPHVQNRDRVAAAQTAIEQYQCQVIIVDDGFQHRRLHRDLDLVVIDALVPFGYGRVFPRGMLREPMEGLRRADLLLLSRADQVHPSRRVEIRDLVARYAPRTSWIEVAHHPTELVQASGSVKPVDHLSHTPLAAFCGIGNPAAFRGTLSDIEYQLLGIKTFPDHYQYNPADLETLAAWAADLGAEALVCTHKDLVKINQDQLGGLPCWALTVDIRVNDGQDELDEKLKSILKSFQEPSFRE